MFDEIYLYLLLVDLKKKNSHFSNKGFNKSDITCQNNLLNQESNFHVL